MPAIAEINAVVRGLTAASKALRLYPASSPIPRQSVDTAQVALEQLFFTSPELTLGVNRDGLEVRDGIEPMLVGGMELCEILRSHGVAEVRIQAGCTSDELLKFLGIVITDPVRLPEGGLPDALSSANVYNVRATVVNLIVADVPTLSPDEDVDAFLRRLATDPQALAAWLSAATGADPASLSEGLLEIAAAGASAGVVDFGRQLATAFGALETTSRDALFGLGLNDPATRGLIGSMLTALPSPDVASSLAEGLYGKNMLSLSNALAKLPMPDKLDNVIAEVRRTLPFAGKSEKEVGFFEHMLEVRARTAPEVPAVTADPSYRSIAEATILGADELADAVAAAARARRGSSERSVRTILTLLDQQRDFNLYCQALDGLATMVPGLLERGEAKLAAKVLADLSTRESRTTQPWPELSQRIQAAMTTATGARTMRALLKVAGGPDPDGRAAARDILRYVNETSMQALLEAAMEAGADGIGQAETLVGRRVVDMLAAYAPKANVSQLSAIVSRLAAENEPRAASALDGLMKRTDSIARREIAAGLGVSGGAIAVKRLQALTRDSDEGVQGAAIRGLARCKHPGAVTALSQRLGEIDIDGKDFALGREIIGALARHPMPEAGEALERLAGRKALLKRGHFAEVQQLAQQALRARTGGAR